MMPVVAGEIGTRRQILIYAVLLAPLGCAGDDRHGQP